MGTDRGEECHRRTVLRAAAAAIAAGATTPAAAGPTDDSPGTNGEAAGSWSQQAKLVADDADPHDELGKSVSVSADGTTALVGASGDDTADGYDAGAAYVFEYAGSWSQQAKLTAGSGGQRGFFGRSVSISADGTTAVVGADFEGNRNGTGAGSAYVFEDDGGWSQQAKLIAADGDRSDTFGKAVAVADDGTTIVVGANGDEDPNGERAGSAYVFEHDDGWTETAKLVPEDGDAGDRFGDAVSLSDSGTTAVVGAIYAEDANGSKSGSAYVFEHDDGWTETAKLVPDDSNDVDLFGTSIAASRTGTTVFVGASAADTSNGGRSGATYVFEHDDGWTETAKLVPEDGDTDDIFGESVAASATGQTVVVGAIGDEDPNGDDGGSVYVFEHEGGWTETQKLVPNDGRKGAFFGEVALSESGARALAGAWGDRVGYTIEAGSTYVFETPAADPLSRFDTNGQQGIQRDEVRDAFDALVDGSDISGRSVSVEDLISLIARYNS